jgi:hypothetical protein
VLEDEEPGDLGRHPRVILEDEAEHGGEDEQQPEDREEPVVG